MTKEEAEKKLADQKDISLGFCPIIRNLCRKDCISYKQSWINQTSPDNYSFYKDLCRSPLISGEISVD